MHIKKKWMVHMAEKESAFPNWRFFDHYIMYFCMMGFLIYVVLQVAAAYGIIEAILTVIMLICVYTPIFISEEKTGGMFHGHYTLSKIGIHYWYILPFSIIPIFRSGCIYWKYITQIELSHYYCADGSRITNTDTINCFFIHLQGGGERHVTFRVKNYDTEKVIDVMIISFNEERYREFLQYYPDIIDERRKPWILTEE